MTTTHTQGKWIVNDKIRNQLYVERQDGGFVCDLQLDAAADGVESVKRDARLIAAAPELLDVVKRLVKVYETGDNVSDFLRTVRHVIAKAES